VFEQALFEVTRKASIVDDLVCLADQNVNVEKFLHLLACQAVVFGAPVEQTKMYARLRFTPAWQPSLFATLQSEGWRRGWDSNPRGLAPCRFSRPEPSTTRPPLRGFRSENCAIDNSLGKPRSWSSNH
jgi:hypothetical protein